MQSRSKAIQALKCARGFSTSAPRPALSPFRKTTQVATTKIVREDAKRPASTAAAATETEQPQDRRARPAPAFNREDYSPQPLRRREREMDHSFVGMKGGEIFHEMMLRQGVKHVCMVLPAIALPLS
jgi:acetolactate synthase-1/2/3 large subunit